MNEHDARAATLLQAFETAQPALPAWGDDDRAWATRLALQEAGADPQAFIASRARHAMQRLAPREPAAARLLARDPSRRAWLAWTVLAGLLLGLLADSLGGGQRINLLAPPLWGVLGWNALVYLLLLGHGLALLMRREARPGVLVRLTQRLWRLGALPGLRATGSGGSARLLPGFAGLWLRRSAALSAARAATLLHAAAAALALGLIGGMYLRGLVLDYRAAWESTFLSAGAAHAALALLLAPAAAISGVALPDAAAFAALRTVHGSAATGASAAPWIHLLATTLLLFVVLPRTALAGIGAVRAHWLARHMRLPPDDPYVQQLLRQQRGDVARAVAWPYACAPGAQAEPRLQALLAAALGDGSQLRIEPTVPFGAEDGAGAPLPDGTTLALALFDLSATPEAESQGRFVRELAARAKEGAATIVAVDEAAFKRRFPGDTARLAQRRDAWCAFGETLGTLPVFVDLDAPDLVAAPRAVQLALRSPVQTIVP
jgi:hypothetical protein